MARKTFNVKEFTQQINAVLAKSTCSPDHRQGTMMTLEQVLHATGNYRGFRYLTQAETPAGFAPGINIDVIGQDIEAYKARFANTDNTRVSYHISA